MARPKEKANRVLKARIQEALRRLEQGDAQRAFAELNSLRADAPDNPILLHALARTTHALGRFDLAAGYAGQAIRHDPRPEFHITLGLSLLALGHAEPARAALHVAVLSAPDLPEARLAHAEILEALGRADDAETELREAIRLRPLEAGLRLVLARFLERQGRAGDALRVLSDARRLAATDDVVIRQQQALLLTRIGAQDDAERISAEIRSIRPEDPAAAANHGAILFSLGRFDDAKTALTRALSLASPTAETLSNLALVEMALGDLESADQAFAEAARLRPDDPRIALNRGTLLSELGQRHAAETLFNRVIEAVPGTPDATRARFNRATIELADGRFGQGWQDFESRRAILAPLPRPDLPDWDGNATTERVLLCGEQGLGDLIQFLRYVPFALDRAPVCLVLPETLIRLVTDSQNLPFWKDHFRSGRLTITGDSAINGATRKASLLSLPFLLAVAAPPAFAPYLRSRASETVERLHPGLRIGLCHAGGATYRFDRRRSIAFPLLAPLLAVPDIDWVSLRPGETPDGFEPLPDGDMATTATVMAGLDLIITVDTAMAHLAGAIGRPVWLLNRFGGDWRWAKASRVTVADGSQRSLWYPCVRPFDQQTPALPELAWQEPVNALAEALRSLSGG
ncbi:tetratricopeptide repeat protein [Acetobacter fallax]|uniref:Tetratricopeptide repeat protein n=1 Tax=Acetobacter fallax TaxID=1737473 RepID=A0ABX0K7J0_9PROT|nr:tetratricopeptide repeat protein [Acetobacter fallax]NHO30971.1 tetratricopeptide repeat protein [Acetobacter fallax]NHO34528.1 tetratricopeptide repeat protein [Acetobacter fallax]